MKIPKIIAMSLFRFANTPVFTIRYLFVGFLLSLSTQLIAQDKEQQLQEKLNKLSETEIPALKELVTISVTNAPLEEFIRGIASSSGLNVNVEPGLNVNIINNFNNVRVSDVLLFVCKQYGLSINVMGSIINLYKEKAPPTPAKIPEVRFDRVDSLLSINCDNDDLLLLAKEIVNKTGVNIIPSAGLERVKITGYMQNMPFSKALTNLAMANNLKITRNDDNSYVIEKIETTNINTSASEQTGGNNPQPSKSGSSRAESTRGEKGDEKGKSKLQINLIKTDTVSVTAKEIPLDELLKEASQKLNASYYLTAELQGKVSCSIAKAGFTQLLQNMFRGTNYTYRLVNGVYVIGDNKNRDLKEFKVVKLNYRTVDKLLESIPAELKTDMDIKEFTELNSILIGGNPGRIAAFEAFVSSIDLLVPVILIEVLIVDAKKTNTLATGIEAGIGEKAATTKGKVFPEVNASLSSQSINNLINSFNGFGTVKIGNVTPNFYLNLKALESNGNINIRSTPKLSTLNGHEATMSIGTTQYYQEQQNSIYGSINAQSTTTTTYKNVEAKLMVKIKPIVSGDDQITLEIEVKQEDFTDRISEYAPPGKVSREFKSLIRVKNQEMILLGGLEEKSTRESASGVPFLSRIPVIKWFFSSRSKADTDSRLNIFLKPSIIN